MTPSRFSNDTRVLPEGSVVLAAVRGRFALFERWCADPAPIAGAVSARQLSRMIAIDAAPAIHEALSAWAGMTTIAASWGAASFDRAARRRESTFEMAAT